MKLEGGCGCRGCFRAVSVRFRCRLVGTEVQPATLFKSSPTRCSSPSDRRSSAPASSCRHGSPSSPRPSSSPRPARRRRLRGPSPAPPPLAAPSPRRPSEEDEEGEERIKSLVETALEILPSPSAWPATKDLLTFGLDNSGECKASSRHTPHGRSLWRHMAVNLTTRTAALVAQALSVKAGRTTFLA
eukprot:4961233-Prymnesium_polylepis.1